MGSTVILKCDRCGESWDKSQPKDAKGEHRQLWKLSVFSHEVSSPYGQSGMPHFIVDWCRDCIDKFQVLWPSKQEKPTDPPVPTPSERLEALIRELARDEATQAVRESNP